MALRPAPAVAFRFLRSSDSSIFRGKPKDLPAWSLEVETALVRILDLLHAEFGQPHFQHIRRLDLQPGSLEMIFVGKQAVLVAEEHAQDETVRKHIEFQVRCRAWHRRAFKDIYVECPHLLPQALVDVELYVVAGWSPWSKFP